MRLHDRLASLEARGSGRGPLLISWLPEADKMASTVVNGQRYTQAPSEDRAQFFKRVSALMPDRAWVWVDQLDARL